MKKYNLNKCLWGIFLYLLVFAFTGCDDDDEFSDLNPVINWNIDKEAKLRLEDYTGNLGADAQFYDVEEDLINITYDNKTNIHFITPKTLGGNKFKIMANDKEYNVNLYIHNDATIRSWYVQSIRKGIECSSGIRTEIEEELDKRNCFIYTEPTTFYFQYYSSRLTPLQRYAIIFFPNSDSDYRIECDSKYDIETKEFTITERANPEHSQVMTFHIKDASSYNPSYITSDFTTEMQQKYGKDKVVKACLYYDVYCTNSQYIKE